MLTKKEAVLETSLGNLLADICLSAGYSIFKAETGRGVDFALFNYGGLRASLNEGTIRVKDVFQLMPFENRLVVVELNGKQVGDLIDFLVRQKKAHPITGLRLELARDNFSKTEIREERFDPKKNYYVITHDYLQHGGNNMSFFSKPLQLFVSDLKVEEIFQQKEEVL